MGATMANSQHQHSSDSSNAMQIAVTHRPGYLTIKAQNDPVSTMYDTCFIDVQIYLKREGITHKNMLCEVYAVSSQSADVFRRGLIICPTDSMFYIKDMNKSRDIHKVRQDYNQTEKIKTNSPI